MYGAGKEARTLDLYLGKVSLYQLSYSRIVIILAEWTGLEPATPGVTGRYSNQLNYRSFGDPTGIRTPVLTVKG